MYKLIVSLILLTTYTLAVDFTKLKEDVLKYVNTLDHPHRDMSNTFSKNLVIADDAEKTQMIIYMSDVTMVSQEKYVEIPQAGDVKLMYTGVPIKVDISSVSMIFDQAVKLFSQQYAYDVISFDSLLNHYMGKYILYINSNLDKKRKKATLLSSKPILVQDIKDKTIFKPHQIFFEDIPDDMAVTPSLFWDIHTEAKRLSIKLEYLTKGISWKSDYNVYIKDKSHFNLNSWITIQNSSGAFYKDANISLIAGEVKQVDVSDNNETNQTHKAVSFSLGKKEIETKPKYVRYAIAHTEDIKNNETKQISFIEGKNITYSSHLHNKMYFDLKNFGERKLQFLNMLRFKNSKENHLGISLPQGIMRFYRHDTLKGKHFLGSAKLPRVNSGEMVDISIGTSKDVYGNEKVLTYKKERNTLHIVYSITLKNLSGEKQSIHLLRSFPSNIKVSKYTTTCKKTCSQEKVSGSETRYFITLDADESYNFEIRYIADNRTDTKGNVQ